MIFCNRNIPKSDPRQNNIKKVNDILIYIWGNDDIRKSFLYHVFLGLCFFGFLGLCTFIGLKGKIK
jgi:hypothetical protein